MSLRTALFLFLAAFSLARPAAAAETLHLGKFSSGDLSGWTEKTFKGKTAYTLFKDGDKTVVKAHSVNAASGLIRKISADPRKLPILRWSWKVSNLIQKEDIRKKNGDDFAARIYVVFPGTFFWQTKAITYAWTAKMPKGATLPNPYTGNAMIISAESGAEKLGQWVNEERNIYEDYRRLFNKEPPEIGAVAIMTDTDDTQEDVTAFYGDIFLAP
jgi:hypothetical protein